MLAALMSQASMGSNTLTLFDSLTLTAGLRHDDDHEFGGHNSVKLAAAFPLHNWGMVLHANYGDGFKAPTLFEQFSQFSNPLHALAPEVANGWEAGIEQRLFGGALVAEATYFSRRTDDQIDFFVPNCFSNPPPEVCKARPFGYYDNIARTRADGIELEATVHLGDEFSVNAAFTEMTAHRPHHRPRPGAAPTYDREWNYNVDTGRGLVRRRYRDLCGTAFRRGRRGQSLAGQHDTERVRLTSDNGFSGVVRAYGECFRRAVRTGIRVWRAWPCRIWRRATILLAT